MKRSVLLSLLLLLCAVPLVRAAMPGPGMPPPAPVVEVGEVLAVQDTQSRRYTGRVVSPATVSLVPRVAGEILEVGFRDGDTVQAGQMLYRIDPGSAATALEQAQVAVQQAQLAYDSTADGLRPRASGSGVVQKLYVKKGDTVSAGSPIADISDTASMTLTLPFQSADAARISVGQSAQVTLAGTLETLPGTVEYVAGADQVGSGGALVRQVKIRVNNPGALTEATSATAKVGTASCAAGGTFEARPEPDHHRPGRGRGHCPERLGGQPGSPAGELLARWRLRRGDHPAKRRPLPPERAALPSERPGSPGELHHYLPYLRHGRRKEPEGPGDQLDGSESGALAVIYDLEQLELKMNVSELDIGKIRPGQSVEITAEALPGETFLGTVEKVNINGTTTDGFTTYPVTILLSEYGALNPGMNVSADIIVEQAQQVLCIPTPPSPAAIRSWLPRMGPWAKTAPCSTPPSWRRARWSWAAAARTMWRSSPAWRRGRPCWCPSSQQTVPPAPLP